MNISKRRDLEGAIAPPQASEPTEWFWFDVGNRAVCEIEFELGPCRFRAAVMSCGRVMLPSAIRDDKLRREIGDKLRGAVLSEMRRRWAKISALPRHMQ